MPLYADSPRDFSVFQRHYDNMSDDRNEHDDDCDDSGKGRFAKELDAYLSTREEIL